jgi:hypothetical protein
MILRYITRIDKSWCVSGSMVEYIQHTHMRVCCIGPLGIQFFGYNTLHGYVSVFCVSVQVQERYRYGTVQVRADGMDPCQIFNSALKLCNPSLSNASGFKHTENRPRAC